MHALMTFARNRTDRARSRRWVAAHVTARHRHQSLSRRGHSNSLEVGLHKGRCAAPEFVTRHDLEPYCRGRKRWSDQLNKYFYRSLGGSIDVTAGNSVWMALAKDRKFWDEIEDDFIKFLNL